MLFCPYLALEGLLIIGRAKSAMNTDSILGFRLVDMLLLKLLLEWS